MTVEELEKAVAKMRELGVTEWNGIKLGPSPSEPMEPPTPEQIRARLDEAADRQHAIMFGASSVRPLRKVGP